MSLNLLHYFLDTELAAFFLIFCRVGAALMTMPGYSDVHVPVRIRLFFALLLCLILTPVLVNSVPPMPKSVLLMMVVMVQEITVGAFMGLLVRHIVATTHVAGNIVAQESSLAVGAIFDPNSGATSPVISNILGAAALALFFVLDFHHLILAAIVKSYDLFTIGQLVNTGDMAKMSMRWMADAFSIGVLLSAPFIIYSLMFYLIGGLLTRLMPNFQVFFIFIPPQIVVALLLFLAVFPMMLQYYNGFLENRLQMLIGG